MSYSTSNFQVSSHLLPKILEVGIFQVVLREEYIRVCVLNCLLDDEYSQTVLLKGFKLETLAFENWLRTNGFSIDDLQASIQAATKNFDARGKEAYRTKVITSEFIVEWLKVNKQDSWKNLLQDESAGLNLFRLATLQLAEAGWSRQGKLFCPKDINLGSKAPLDVESFQNYAILKEKLIAERIHSHFDPFRDDSCYGIKNYIEKSAVNMFLNMSIHRSRKYKGELLKYIEESKKLDERTKLAFKLLYIPPALRTEEIKQLEEEYGIAHNPLTKRKVKDVAKNLGFGTGPRLSRKMYKVANWAKAWKKTNSNGATKRK